MAVAKKICKWTLRSIYSTAHMLSKYKDNAKIFLKVLFILNKKCKWFWNDFTGLLLIKSNFLDSCLFLSPIFSLVRWELLTNGKRLPGFTDDFRFHKAAGKSCRGSFWGSSFPERSGSPGSRSSSGGSRIPRSFRRIRASGSSRASWNPKCRNIWKNMVNLGHLGPVLKGYKSSWALM